MASKSPRLNKAALENLDDYIFGLSFPYAIILKLSRTVKAILALANSDRVASFQGIETGGIQYFRFMARRSSRAGLRCLDKSTSCGTIWSRTTWPLSLVLYRLNSNIYYILSYTLLIGSSIYLLLSLLMLKELPINPLAISWVAIIVVSIITSNQVFFQLVNLTWEIIPWSFSILMLGFFLKGHLLAGAITLSICIFMHPSIALFSFISSLSITPVLTFLKPGFMTQPSFLISISIIGLSGTFMYALLANIAIPGIGRQIHERCRNAFLNGNKNSLREVFTLYFKLRACNKPRNSNILSFMFTVIIYALINFLLPQTQIMFRNETICAVFCLAIAYMLLDLYNRYKFFMSKYTINTLGLYIILIIFALTILNSNSWDGCILATIPILVHCNTRFSGYPYLLDHSSGNIALRPVEYNKTEYCLLLDIEKNLGSERKVLIYNVSTPSMTFELLPRLCDIIDMNIENVNFLLSPVNELIGPSNLLRLRESIPYSFKSVLKFSNYFEWNNLCLILVGKSGSLKTILPPSLIESTLIRAITQKHEACIVSLSKRANSPA